MTLRRLSSGAGLLFAAALAWPLAAHAELKICNQTSYILYTAVGSATQAELDAHGWVRIEPGDCGVGIDNALTAPAYFIYAKTSQAHAGAARAWGGKVPICARDTNFNTKTKLPIKGCPGSDYYRMPFALVERHGRTSWTATLTEGPSPKSLKEAKRAGINRLLTDLGYHVNVPGDRARDLALDDFHKHMKLPADATDSDLFDALETEALKIVAPAGFTICNDTDGPLSAAIGIPKNKAVDTRGWWQIGAGACSRVVNDALKTDRVYLLAEDKDKRPLVSGPTKLCVADLEFEILGNGSCSKGLKAMGFAVTSTKGRSGYVASIGENGLLPPAPLPAYRTGTAK